jgi:PAS domain S-box-containing protein
VASAESDNDELFVPGEALSDEAISPDYPPDAKDGFALFVEGATEYAVFALSCQGVVCSWNRGAQRIKGFVPEEVIGRHFGIFYTEEDRQVGLPNRLLALALSEGRAEVEGWRLRKDGSRFWASVLIVPLRDATGCLRGFGKLTRDASDRRAAVVAHERTAIISEQERIATALASTVVRRLFSVGLSLDGAAQAARSDPATAARIRSATSEIDDTIKYLRSVAFEISKEDDSPA